MQTLLSGQIDNIGHESKMHLQAHGGGIVSQRVDAKNPTVAVGLTLRAISEMETGTGLPVPVDAVGHRVVHGGSRFVSPTLLDEPTLSALEALNELAPLHNPAAIEGIRATRDLLGAEVPEVAVFDTAFHATLPEEAYTYALPFGMSAWRQVRRYGFHGTAHEYMLRRYSQLAGIAPEEATIITLQLGNGCSATAIKNGRSVDTSMGFTPLAGLVMGTRPGDLDPGVTGYLAEKEGLSPEQVNLLLNRQSGLLGISGLSGDMRDLISAAEKNPRAQLAIDVFCYAVRKYIGAYLAALGGADAVVFGGGIGENSPAIRAHICGGLEWCGLRLDPVRNSASVGTEDKISADGASLEAYVLNVNEDILIAQHTADAVRAHKHSSAEC